ncbi:MAG: hypothetical protein ACRCXZ_06570 [Patescibacteria group bacterium]
MIIQSSFGDKYNKLFRTSQEISEEINKCFFCQLARDFSNDSPNLELVKIHYSFRVHCENRPELCNYEFMRLVSDEFQKNYPSAILFVEQIAEEYFEFHIRGNFNLQGLFP